jgi:16S rRNA G966 N2-methylase RsmD
MDNNIINKIFPYNTNSYLLKYDNEGLWSITLPKEADIICDIIMKEFASNDLSIDLTIFDGTGGIGGNTIAFAKCFNKVITVELNKNRYDIIKHNIQSYDFKNVEVINGSCIDYLDIEADVYFYDPPWGGPEYKLIPKLRIQLGGKHLNELVKSKKLNIFKLPSNYDLDEFNSYNYKVIKIKNYLLIVI